MRDRILSLLRKIVPKGTPIEVNIPEDGRFGHYSTNVAFRLSRAGGKTPFEIASSMRDSLAKSPYFEKIEAAPPGFLNFWISGDVLRAEMRSVVEKGEIRLKARAPRKKIQIEFISANPTGPLTLANGRGGFLGDALANVLSAVGNRVEREYYVNDTGNQITTLGKSLLAAGGFLAKEDTFYRGDYITEWARTHASLLKKYKENPSELGRRAAKDFLRMIRRTIEKKSGIRFDRYTSEFREVHKKNLIPKTIELFRNKGVTYEHDGAIWLKTTKFGDDKDRVLVMRDGTPTYFLADAAHYFETKKRGFDRKINILGPDHHGYVARIQAAAKLIGLESDVLITQAVRLMRKGKEVRMSKRRGAFVKFEALVEEVGADAARFFFLMVAPSTHLDFDLGLAKERSMKNPVYYVQYAFVRAEHILRKMRGKKVGSVHWETLSTPEDINLMLAIARFREVVEATAVDYGVHRLTRYALELARCFHMFYERERVIDESPHVAAARLKLVKASLVTIKSILGLLGISAPKKM